MLDLIQALAVLIFFFLLLKLLWHLFWKPNNWWQRWRHSEVFTLFQATENGQKLLNYIRQHNIRLGIPSSALLEGFWACYYSSFSFPGVLIINKRDLALMSKKNGKVESSIAHELGHLAINSSLFLDTSICPYAKTDFSSDFSCPYGEFLAWQKGWQILQELKINISEDKFWYWALKAIKTYSEKCLLEDWKTCEKLMIEKESVKLFK
ncbi:MAG: hypothetical protein ACP5IX_01225 [Patescibacteria group bacterium]